MKSNMKTNFCLPRKYITADLTDVVTNISALRNSFAASKQGSNPNLRIGK